ncbi:VOC family protein [Streptomyces boncukensis]|uniref:VOC family protein n=1 Tax=Streptomyces boncukensis TaxID=2711219 RepID=A0A6G4WTY5_9ACTN|nr:VOC family protein [Streptomyces boncukensis]NGO68463.1 VOC family protein [Streptomyces boncukensis]
MTLSLYQIAVDAHDLAGLARFWAQVLDWRIVHQDPDEVIIAPSPEALPGIVFLPVPEEKAGKNRLHLDLTPGEGEWDAEVERLLALGARRADVGQREDVPWIVLADPEGNEFCVLAHKKTLLD